MGKMLFVITDLCTGCNRCTLVCSAVKEGLFVPSKARIHVNNFPLAGFSAPSICFQCSKADCLNACPVEAIYKSDDGVVLIREGECTGCGECVDACPYGMIELSENDIAYKCDYCGGDPACVKVCYPHALVFGEPEREFRKQRGLQMRERSDIGRPGEKRNNLGTNLLEKRRNT